MADRYTELQAAIRDMRKLLDRIPGRALEDERDPFLDAGVVAALADIQDATSRIIAIALPTADPSLLDEPISDYRLEEAGDLLAHPYRREWRIDENGAEGPEDLPLPRTPIEPFRARLFLYKTDGVSYYATVEGHDRDTVWENALLIQEAPRLLENLLAEVKRLRALHLIAGPLGVAAIAAPIPNTRLA